MTDRNGTELKIGTFVSEVGSGGLGCVVLLDVTTGGYGPTADFTTVCIVAWRSDSDTPGGLMTFDPWDLVAVS